MHMIAEDTKNPELKLAPIDPDFKAKVEKLGYFKNNEFEIIVEFGTGICLPKKGKKY